MKTLAVLHAAQLVTLAGSARPRVGGELGDLAIISGGGMLIRDGVIVSTGPSDLIEKQLGGDAVIVDARGRVVLPGFVDAHTHLVFGGNRVDEFELRARGATYEEIAASGGGIRSTVCKTRAATEEELKTQALKHAQWFLQCGTTTVEAKSGYGLSLSEELKILRVIRALGAEAAIEFVPTFLGAHAIPEEHEADLQRYVEIVVNEMLPAVAAEGLAEYCDIFCERGYFDIETARGILKAAQRHGLGLRMHVDQLTNSGGAQLAADLSAKTADHLEQSEDDGIAALLALFQPRLVRKLSAPAKSDTTGSASAPPTPNTVRPGPTARMSTVFGAPSLTTRPGMSTLAPVPTCARTAVLMRREVPAVAVTSAS